MKHKTKHSRKRVKELVAVGGWELLSKLIPDGLTKEGLLNQYGKSLYVFACVNKIAEKVASINLVMQRIINSRGEMKEIKIHPLIDLLYKPNKFQTRTEFWKILVINLKCAGEAFVFKVRNKSGKVVELWNLRPDRMTIVKDPVMFIREYRFRLDDGKESVFAPEDIIHFKAPDPLDAYGGISPLFAAKLRVETEGFATSFQRDFFVNNGRPDAILTTGTRINKDDKEEIKLKWNAQHQGKGNNSKIAILSGGMQYQQIAVSQRDMDYIEGLKMTRDDILIAFGVPKSVVGITEDVNRANAEVGMSTFLTETVKPTIGELIEKINEEMTYVDFDQSIELEFEDPTPSNRELMLQEHSQLVPVGVILINEARIERGLEPVKGGWSFYVSPLQVPGGGLPQGTKMIKVGGKSKEDAYLRQKPSRLYHFRGRPMLYKKLVFIETMKKEFVKMMTRKAKPKKGKLAKGVWKPLIPKEIRADYANMILKGIDSHSEPLAKQIEAFALEQRDRVITKLNKVKSKARSAKGLGKLFDYHAALPEETSSKGTVTIEKIFDATKEQSLLVDFISPKLLQILQDAGISGMETVAPAETFQERTTRIQKFIKKRSELMADSVNGTTVDGLKEAIQSAIEEGLANEADVSEISKMIQTGVDDVFGEFPIYRSDMIARTEATASSNEGLLESYRQSDVVTGKEWINAGDARVRDEHMDAPEGVGGEIVANDATFSNGLAYPQEPNCRCVLGPAFLEES